ncbi:hypothetical protein B0H21DRAFT_460379 [Amylocystis lapponica]|nr:hypothetical protein B0H21DRAFT_460379 [Amylocystis lapponica]
MISALIPLLAASSALGASLLRSPARYDVLSSRQARVQRDLLDVCVGLDVDLTVNPAGIPVLAGHLDVCLCISLLPDFITTNAVAQAAVNLVDKVTVLTQLEALINSQSDKQQCTYPPHTTQICELSWPCGWQCTDGYEPYTPRGAPHPTQCVCPAPKSECNGKCGSFPHGCGSATPRRKRSAQTCAHAWCPVAGGGQECVDTVRDSESCGGCVSASSLSSLRLASAPKGVNCHAIPHVDDVLCQASACVVSTCKAGFVPTAGRDACVAALAVEVRDVAGAKVVEGLVADVKGVAKVGEGVVAGVRVGRDVADAGVVEGLFADVKHVAKVGEGVVADVRVGRDVADAGVVEGLFADVKHVAKVGEGVVAGVRVGRDVADAGVVEGLFADVKHVATVGEGLVAGVRVERDVADAHVVEGLFADVKHVASAAEGAVVGLHVGRDIPLVGAVVSDAAAVLVPHVAAAGALVDAGVHVL